MRLILAEMLAKRGMTQAELSKRSGVPQPIISNIVTGRTPTPGYDTVFLLSRALRCEMEEMISLTDNPSHDKAG